MLWSLISQRNRSVALAALFVLLLSGISTAQVSTYQATGTGWTSLDQGITKTNFLITQVATPAGGVNAHGGWAQEIRNPSSTAIIAVSAGGSGLALAEPGRLAAYAHGYASVAGPGTLGGHVVGNFGATATEYIPITHPTLPVGSIVEFTVKSQLFGTTSSEIPNTGPYKYSGFPYPTGTFYFMFMAYTLNGSTLAYNNDAVGSGTYSFPNGLFTSVPTTLNIPDFFTYNMTGKVGDYLVLYNTLGLGVEDRAYDGYGGYQESTLDFSHTVRTYADGVTPGLNFAANSHYYTSPEPTSAAILLLAACGLSLRRTTP